MLATCLRRGRRDGSCSPLLLDPGLLLAIAATAGAFRAHDGLDVNVQLVRVGAAAPYFFDYRRGRYAPLLVRLARRAQGRHLGLWGRCPGTPWDPNHSVSTGPP